MFLQETLPLRDDPVSHLVLPTTGTYIAKVSSNDFDLILTRISASFGATKREVIQNGI